MTAMRRCARHRAGFHRHTERRDCGCRLAVVNDVLLMDPSQLNWRQRAPGLLFRGTGEPLHVMAAYVDGIGANLPMTIYDRSGAAICQGRYSVDPIEVIFGFGPFSLTCDGGAVAASGKLSVKKVYLDEGKRAFLTAIGKGQSDDGAPFKFILGIPRRIYDAAPGQFE